MNPWSRRALWMLWLSTTAGAQSKPIDPPCPPGTMAAEVAAHGDTVILSWLEPVESGGFALRFETYDKGHTIDPRDELPVLRRFLAEQLGVT